MGTNNRHSSPTSPTSSNPLYYQPFYQLLNASSFIFCGILPCRMNWKFADLSLVHTAGGAPTRSRLHGMALSR